MVQRIRRAAGSFSEQPQEPLPQDTYRGFGTVRGETLNDFHDRMFEIDPFEAMMYELEVELECRPQ